MDRELAPGGPGARRARGGMRSPVDERPGNAPRSGSAAWPAGLGRRTTGGRLVSATRARQARSGARGVGPKGRNRGSGGRRLVSGPGVGGDSGCGWLGSGLGWPGGRGGW